MSKLICIQPASPGPGGQIGLLFPLNCFTFSHSLLGTLWASACSKGPMKLSPQITAVLPCCGPLDSGQWPNTLQEKPVKGQEVWWIFQSDIKAKEKSLYRCMRHNNCWLNADVRVEAACPWCHFSTVCFHDFSLPALQPDSCDHCSVCYLQMAACEHLCRRWRSSPAVLVSLCIVLRL